MALPLLGLLSQGVGVIARQIAKSPAARKKAQMDRAGISQ